MFRMAGAIGIALAAMSINGCANVTDLFAVNDAFVLDPKAPAESSSSTKDDEPVRVGDIRLRDKSAYKEALQVAATAAMAPSDTGKRDIAILWRNELQAHLFDLSDKECEKHQVAILANSAQMSFGTSLGATILSTISAAVGAEVAKTALATVSSAVSATGTAVKAEFYQNLFATAIVRKIRQARSDQRAVIEGKASKTTIEYTVPSAIRDAEEYHGKCSFYAGLVALTDDGRKVEVLTWDQIGTRISSLETENTALLAKIKDTTNPSSVRFTAQRSYDLNAAEIERLRAVRIAAPKEQAGNK